MTTITIAIASVQFVSLTNPCFRAKYRWLLAEEEGATMNGSSIRSVIK